MNNKYYLKHFDTPILAFNINTDFGIKIENIEILNEIDSDYEDENEEYEEPTSPSSDDFEL